MLENKIQNKNSSERIYKNIANDYLWTVFWGNSLSTPRTCSCFAWGTILIQSILLLFASHKLRLKKYFYTGIVFTNIDCNLI